VKAYKLFDKISSKQIWKTHFEKMNQVKEWSDQLNQMLWNKLTEAQHQLQSTKEVTSFSSILFSSFKQS